LAAVGRRVGKAHGTEDGRHIDDGAAAALQHGGDLVFAGIEHAREIDAQHLLPGIQWIVGRGRTDTADAGVVAGHIQTAEVAHGQGHQRFMIRRAAGVGAQIQCLGTQLAHQGCGLLALLLVEVGQHHPRAFPGPCQRHTAAYAGRSPVTNATLSLSIETSRS
jgi:hypothetical protein